MKYTIHHGDCLDLSPTIPDASVDAVITDPPYPEISRDYGRLTEAQWWDLMMGVCTEVRRVLKPTGSAVFILQPNSRKVGSMRGWLWEFMAWVCREWNMVQDVWWWNVTTMPGGCAVPKSRGLMRPSLKACVWAGNNDCHRKQSEILLPVSDFTKRQANKPKDDRIEATASGRTINRVKASQDAIDSGGSTPFNVLPFPNARGHETSGGNGHGAGTPLKLADWWVRYIVPSGGVVLDPFNGAGTMGVAALQNGHTYIGIEKMPQYVDVSHERLAKVQPALIAAD